ncbi:class I SAM-dependent methyltransferase [Actinoplanes sp. NPDC049265]|uniref:class I SAM-dependent methyltransferase n=1 Tax=Actinoplanes sp. NPDC049265 TaxID=3363902 RepID=UPI00371AD4A3
MKELGRRVLRRLLRLTPHTIGIAAATLAGAGAIAAALSGRTPIAVAWSAALLTATLVVTVHLHRGTTARHDAQQESAGELRDILEQLQRRVIATVEKERLEAGDRHLELTDTITRGLTPEGAEALLRAQNRELDAVIQLSRTVVPRAPMPIGDTGPTPADLLALLHLTRSRKPGLTVALGAGPASIWLGYAAEHAGRVVVVEHDPARADRLRTDLVAHNLTGVEVVRAPLVELTLDGRTTDWYDVDALTSLTDIGLLLVDGPATDPLPPALHVLGRRLADDGVVVSLPRSSVPRQHPHDGFRLDHTARWTVLSRATSPATSF